MQEMTASSATPLVAWDTWSRRLRPLAGIDALVRHRPSITWYGPAPFPDGWPASEAVVQALTGLMEVNGRDSGRPRRCGIEVASVAAGLLAAQGSLAAAIAERRGRPVGAVRTSVLQAGLLLLSNYFVVATALGDSVPGRPLPEPGPPFRTADGTWFEIDTFDAEAWKAFWVGLGAGGADLGRAWTIFQWRYERATCSFPPGLHDATARHPLAVVAKVAAATGVSLAPVLEREGELPEGLAAAAHPLVRSVAGVAGAAGSAAGAGTGAGEDLPLAGVRVVEATSRIQGPFAGMLLRMLGADVVRVQPPDGDYGRAALCLHRAKETVVLDLASAAGRGALVELVAGADVFLQNWRPGKAAEWGLDVDDLVRVRPGLVYAHTSGWGDRPEARRLMGTDFLVQASTGLGRALHPEGEPAFPSRVVLCDVFGGLVGAEGILTALWCRERSGGAWEVRSSLLAGAMALQAHVLEAIGKGAEVGRRCGRPVWGVLDRPVPTADGTVVVSVADDEAFARLCQVCEVDAAGAARADTERRLAACLGEGTAARWAELLARAGIPAAVACDDVATVPSNPRLHALFEPVGVGGLAPRSPWSFR
jgi:crotonobetainyl-CoA:carnitine CoA-transferase CaiB-like acyl-CoA transferase